jgi:5-hydroxyisourate hydrolase
MSSPITTHILDTALGRPASGVPITLEFQESDGTFRRVGQGSTNADGRVADLLAAGDLRVGTYRIRFDTASYFRQQDGKGFYPYVDVVFSIEAPDEHYHVPLLLNPFGYSTYRGS